MTTFSRGLCWVRRDLRLRDHAALAAATRSCGEVAVVFVFDTTILNQLVDRDDRRVTFIRDALQGMEAALQAAGSRLLILHGDPVDEIPRVMRQLGAQALFYNRDYEPSAKKRDQVVRQSVEAAGARCFDFKDQVIFEGLEVSRDGEQPYRVFTPYSRNWLGRLTPAAVEERVVAPNRWIAADVMQPLSKPLHLETMGFVRAAGPHQPDFTRSPQQQLQSFMHGMAQYDQTRDFPARDNGTSRLSVHLRFGTLSIREAVRATQVRPRTSGHETWLRELIWRDFYHMILDQFPHVVEGAFKPEYDRINWPGTEDDFKSWCDGQTGFPLVDAAMRQLRETGWMHNRCRMVVASFLTKDLLVDWRRGESWFARWLLDFDLAANNGGWQWCASTGCDAQPYFRIFNPVNQSEKFDPDGSYIRRWVPELARVPTSHIHWPHKGTTTQQQQWGCVMGRDYPHPIVDHAAQRIVAQALFKGIG